MARSAIAKEASKYCGRAAALGSMTHYAFAGFTLCSATYIARRPPASARSTSLPASSLVKRGAASTTEVSIWRSETVQ
jgi:hypothetical protein